MNLMEAISKNKTIFFEAKSSEEVSEYLSNLLAEDFNEGDRAEVTYPDGTKHIYVFKTNWNSGEDKEYTLRP